MSGWLDNLFGNLPQQPAHPPSRGEFWGPGYRAMPDMTAPIEDARGNHNIPPSSTRPHDRLPWTRSGINPFGTPYNMDQWDYLESHLPGGQMPTTALQDPDFAYDPSIVANIRDAQQQAYRQRMGGWADLPSPADQVPQPPPTRRGPQLTSDQVQNLLQQWQGGMQ